MPVSIRVTNWSRTLFGFAIGSRQFGSDQIVGHQDQFGSDQIVGHQDGVVGLERLVAVMCVKGPNKSIFPGNAMTALGAPAVSFTGDDNDGGLPRSIDLRLMSG